MAGRNRRQVLFGLAATLTLPVPGVSMAQSAAEVAAWQRVITLQIEAFRGGDAEAAYRYAGAAFKAVFSSAGIFFLALTRSRYALIAGSRSHRFGSYVAVNVGATGGVAQEVTIVSPEQELRQAIYFMQEEPEGWRVQGLVVLGRGVAI